jgi:hypothetical protein
MAPRSAIAEVKQCRLVIGWVTRKFLSRASPCFGRHVEPLIPAAFAVVSTHQPALLKCFCTIAPSSINGLSNTERIFQIGPVVPEISAFKQTNFSAI